MVIGSLVNIKSNTYLFTVSFFFRLCFLVRLFSIAHSALCFDSTFFGIAVDPTDGAQVCLVFFHVVGHQLFELLNFFGVLSRHVGCFTYVVFQVIQGPGFARCSSLFTFGATTTGFHTFD